MWFKESLGQWLLWKRIFVISMSHRYHTTVFNSYHFWRIRILIGCFQRLLFEQMNKHFVMIESTGLNLKYPRPLVPSIQITSGFTLNLHSCNKSCINWEYWMRYIARWCVGYRNLLPTVLFVMVYVFFPCPWNM